MGLAVLGYLIVLGISLYGLFLGHSNTSLFNIMVVFAASAVILALVAGVWAHQFEKHYRETAIFSGKTRIIHAQTARDDKGAEVVELFCAVSEEDNYLKVFRVPATDTARDYQPGDVIDLVWTGKDPHFSISALVQYAHPA